MGPTIEEMEELASPSFTGDELKAVLRWCCAEANPGSAEYIAASDQLGMFPGMKGDRFGEAYNLLWDLGALDEPEWDELEES